MIDAMGMSQIIFHKEASKGERVWSAGRRTSVAINMFGSINGQAFV
jgi:hypothetical protein